jgi:thiamine biosynthesis protein ThiS
MQISVIFEGKDKKLKTKEMKVKNGSKIADVLKELGINRETVLVRRNGKIVPEEEKIKDRDKIEVIRITSGG